MSNKTTLETPKLRYSSAVTTDRRELTSGDASATIWPAGQVVVVARDPRGKVKRVEYNRYGGPEEMYFGDYVLPPLESNQVRVIVKAAAINPLDWKLRQGAMKLIAGRGFPKGMGSDFAGVVEAIGDGVTNVRVGDEVFGTLEIKKAGAFAEMIIAESHLVARKPSQLSFNEAACLSIPATTAWAAIIDKAQARAGSRIFIHGCNGAVGASAVQLALARGAHVAGSCGPGSRASARDAGVDPVFDYADRRSFVENEKFDAIFDTVGTLSVSDGLSMLKPKGVFIDINPTLGRVLRGMLSRRYKLAFSTMGYRHLSDIADVAGDGILRPKIGLEAPFADALSVIANAEAGHRAAGRTVLTL